MNSALAFEELSLGLDRSPLHMPDADHRGKSDEKPTQNDIDMSIQHSFPKMEPGIPRTSRRARLKSKTMSVLHIHQSPYGAHKPTASSKLAPAPSNDDDGDRLFHKVPEVQRTPLKDLIRSPVETVTNIVHVEGGLSFAKNLETKVIPHGADVRLAKAYDKIVSSENEEDRDSAFHDFEEVQKTRQDGFVRWTMDRHVHSVKRIMPSKPPWRDKKEFMVTNEHGEDRLQWGEYIRHLFFYYSEIYGDRYVGASSELPPATKEYFTSSAERLLLTSVPFQTSLMNVRKLYRWEDPYKTAACMFLYFYLWACNYISAAAGLFLLWLVCDRRFNPHTIEQFRENIKRSEDVTRTALSLTELIEQHGDRGFIDPIVDDLGPRVTLQLQDMADFLEVLTNFYEWRNPTRSVATLRLLVLVWLALVLCPAWLTIKIYQFAAGVIFFGLFPISSHYPKYRLLVSPLTFLFWKIPTHAEWAIARMQGEARLKKDAVDRSSKGPATGELEKIDESFGERPSADNMTREQRGDNHCVCNSSTTGDDREATNSDQAQIRDQTATDREVGAYRGSSQGHLGSLCVSFQGVSFKTVMRSKVRWSLKYEELKSIQKMVSSLPFGSSEDIIFINMSDEEFKVSGLKLRDEVFTQVIGFSNVRWQVTG